MSAHKVLNDIFKAEPGRDPGNAGTFVVNQSPLYIPLVSAAAETRTLGRPSRVGTVLTLAMKTDGGDITLTVTGGYNEGGETTLIFDDAGQFAQFIACYDGTSYFWRKIADHTTGGFSTNTLSRGTGVDTAESYSASVQRMGGQATTRIIIDITGMVNTATDLDIMGENAAANCHWGQITTAKCGTIIGGMVTCLEVPAGGSADLDFYSSDVGTGTQDVIITNAALGTEVALVTSGGAWTSGATKGMTSLPNANDYIYITSGTTAGGTMTAGKFLIELFGTL